MLLKKCLTNNYKTMKKLLLFMFALLAFAGMRAESNYPTNASDWNEELLEAYDQEVTGSYSDVIYMKSCIFPAGSGVVEIPIHVKAHDNFMNVQFQAVLPNGLYPQEENNFVTLVYNEERVKDCDGKNMTDEGFSQFINQKSWFSSKEDDVFFSIKVDISSLTEGVYDLKVLGGAKVSGYESNNNGSTLISEDIVTKLVITNEVVLDELATEYPTEYTGVNVRVKRSFTLDQWNTFCLPVAMDETTCKSVFGQNVDIAEFNGYDYTADTKHISVKFNHVKEIKANTPVIIKIASSDTKTYDADKKEFTLTNVDVAPVAANALRTIVGRGMMRGTYTDGTLLYETEEDDWGESTVKYQYVFLSGDKFYYATAKTKPMKGLRAYFQFRDDGNTPLNADAGVKFNFVVDDEPTAINGISSVEKVAEGVYTVSGQKVNESSLEILPKGVYIVNGKKVFKK